MEIDFENALERLGTLREELKHIEGVLQAILDDDMADFVWTSWFCPEHLLYSSLTQLIRRDAEMDAGLKEQHT